MATFHINRSGTSLGTFSEEDVRAGLRSGRFLGTDLGWRDGMPAWQPLAQISEFVQDIPAAGAAVRDGASCFGGFERMAWIRSATIFSSPAAIMYGVIEMLV